MFRYGENDEQIYGIADHVLPIHVHKVYFTSLFSKFMKVTKL